MDSTITITPLAAEQALKMRDSDDAKLRVAVTGGGCAGFQYALGWDDQQDDDLVIDEHGLTVIVDPTSLDLLRGSTVDFETGLNGHGFRIDNPRAVGGCGCGQSFNVADDADVADAPGCGGCR